MPDTPATVPESASGEDRKLAPYPGLAFFSDITHPFPPSYPFHRKAEVRTKGTVQRKLTGVESNINRKVFLSH
jgi:hypothetical protein